jgi:uncharacterized RDD family membrane protein YckC
VSLARSEPANVLPEPISPRAARCAAFLLDLLCGLALAVAFGLIGWLWLLARTDGGTLPPSDATVYTGIALWLLWLPLWAATAVLGWSGSGQSLGLAAFSLRVIGANDAPPSLAAALRRCLLLILFTALLLLGLVLLLFAGSAAAVGTVPFWVALLAALPLLLGAADPAAWLLRRDGRALHDLLAGTWVARRL